MTAAGGDRCRWGRRSSEGAADAGKGEFAETGGRHFDDMWSLIRSLECLISRVQNRELEELGEYSG